MHTLSGKISQKEINDKINYFKNLKEPVEIKNREFLPLFYLIPKEVFCGELEVFSKVSRNPIKAVSDCESLGIIETHYFSGLVLKYYAYYIWIILNQGNNIEAYSLDDPVYKLVHDIVFWKEMLEEEGLIWKPDDLLDFALAYPDYEMPYKSREEIETILLRIVKKANIKYGLLKMIEAIDENRCFEDFEEIRSRQKIDFWRSWYHTRTQHPMTSLEDYLENPTNYGSPSRNSPKYDSKMEEKIVEKVAIDEFMATLPDKDKQILKLRMKDHTMSEIASMLGYANHSGVKKRIDKIGKTYQKFANVDLGF